MIGGGSSLQRENLADTDPPLAKRRFSVYFHSYGLSRKKSKKSSVNKSTTRFPM